MHDVGRVYFVHAAQCYVRTDLLHASDAALLLDLNVKKDRRSAVIQCRPTGSGRARHAGSVT
jgi:hypothetical protein